MRSERLQNAISRSELHRIQASIQVGWLVACLSDLYARAVGNKNRAWKRWLQNHTQKGTLVSFCSDGQEIVIIYEKRKEMRVRWVGHVDYAYGDQMHDLDVHNRESTWLDALSCGRPLCWDVHTIRNGGIPPLGIKIPPDRHHTTHV